MTVAAPRYVQTNKTRSNFTLLLSRDYGITMAELTYTPIRRALISVSDKTGIVEFARTLQSYGVEILSTGGTFKLLQQNDIAATEVSDHTSFPEMMDGRVKTLHPKVHGGILGRRDQDQAVMAEHEIPPIDLVVVNLYPFEATVANPDCDLPTAIENIDIDISYECSHFR